MPVEVRPVAGRADLRAFIDLPYRLHANSPWVPPLRIERRAFLTRRLNPFFKHGEAEYFLARRDGRVVGRITAQIDHAFNAYHDNRWGMFGFLEFEDDPEILPALLEAAAGWLRARERDRMVGPMDFSMNDESGIVIEGHERPPMIRQPWHPPYYQQRCEEAGLTKAMDLFMWHLWARDIENVHPMVFQAAENAQREHNVVLRKMSRRSLRKDLDRFAEVYNAAWSRNWGFVPYSKEDLDTYAMDLQLVFYKEMFMVAERDGETAAVAISIPDVNQVLRQMNGRLLPWGWFRYLVGRRFINAFRVGFLGVKPEFQHTGIAATMFVEHFRIANQDGFKEAEQGWILETNEPMNRAMEGMGGTIIKRYRVYERML